MTRKAGVIGHPIAHSKSPIIHGYWLKLYSIDGEYLPYAVAPESLATDVRRLIDEGCVGFNVTLPHKQSILPLCATLSDEAAKIGAVNTVTVMGDGRLHGHNTDGFGFTENLQETIPEFDWTAAPAAVIGAGGAARAVVSALKDNGVSDIRITNRTYAAADNLAREFGLTPVAWDDRMQALAGVGLVVQSTSLGMHGQPSLSLDLGLTLDNAVVYDIVYNPLQTALLQQAAEIGRRTVTGIGMLLHQARPGFETWFGKAPQVDANLRALLTPSI